MKVQQALGRRALGAFLFLAVLLGGGCQSNINDESVIRIDSSAISARLRDAGPETLLIDARPAEAYEQGHLPGAVNIRLGDLARGTHGQALQRYDQLIVYGQNPGSASAVALAKSLIARGHKGVRLFEGGIEAWRSAGLPVDQARTDLRRQTPTRNASGSSSR